MELKKTGKELMAEVEKEYHAKVMTIEDPQQREDMPGHSSIDDNGIPTILISPVSGRNEETIVHELMHLRGFARGVPWVNFHGDRPVGPEVVEYVRTDLYNMLFHSYFYPELRSLGYKPESAECEWLRKAIVDRRPLPTSSGSIMHASLALYYFRAAYICQDVGLSAMLQTIFNSNGQARAVSEGKALVAIVEGNGFRKPGDVLTVFLLGANEILAGQFRLTLTELKDLRRGHISQRTALVKIDPVN